MILEVALVPLNRHSAWYNAIHRVLKVVVYGALSSLGFYLSALFWWPVRSDIPWGAPRLQSHQRLTHYVRCISGPGLAEVSFFNPHYRCFQHTSLILWYLALLRLADSTTKYMQMGSLGLSCPMRSLLATDKESCASYDCIYTDLLFALLPEPDPGDTSCEDEEDVVPVVLERAQELRCLLVAREYYSLSA